MIIRYLLLIFQEAIDRISYYRGSSDTATAFMTVRTQVFTAENGDRDQVRNLVVVLTDGGSDDNARTINEVCWLLRS